MLDEKIAFEKTKKDLEIIMKNVGQDIENTELDVVRKGSKFMEKSEDRSSTKEDINLLKNVLAA